MSYNTYIQQGSFLADGERKTVNLRGDIDWMHVYNITVLAAAGAGTGAEFRWMRGLTDNTAIEYTKLAADQSLSPDYVTPGFRYFNDQDDSELGAPNTTVTRITAAGAVSCTSTAGLLEGSIVRFFNVENANQISGMDFTVSTIVTNTSFNISALPSNMVDTGAGITGTFRIVNKDPMYSPTKGVITDVTTGVNTFITTSRNVSDIFSEGQYVRFNIPAGCGMPELNGLVGRILGVSSGLNLIEVDIDSSAFTAFAFPLHAAVPVSLPEVVPVGDYGYDLLVNNIGQTQNLYNIGMILEPGTDAPAGSAGDEIYWIAGKSFSVTNE